MSEESGALRFSVAAGSELSVDACSVSALVDQSRIPSLRCPTSIEMPSSKLQQQWNTKNLGLRLGADFTSAASAASMVAPLIAIIDR